jgi:nitrate/nitrite transporter NarK
MSRSAIWKKAARLLVAGFLGYSLIAVLTTVGFEGWLKGADLFRGGPALLARGMLVSLVAGVAGGALAGLIGGRRPLLHVFAVLPFLMADSIYVLFFFDRTTPFWFELLGSLGLMTFTVMGGALIWLLRSRFPGRAESG